MRLLSLKLRNYRLHRELAVDFDRELTLVGGPNETGKSTLVEAAHRALFFPSRRGGADLDAMRSRFTSEPPEVELAFEHGGREYTISKRFAGTRGHAELRDSHHGHFTGEDAETRLAGLLGFSEALKPKEAATAWAHLWVRQGESGGDPAAHATVEQRGLVTRLQTQGGGALMQSDLDARVARRFADAEERLFNQNGSAKAGSPLKAAESAVADAGTEHAARSARAAELEATIGRYESAKRRHEDAANAIPGIAALEAETVEKLKASEEISRRHAETEARKQTAAAALKSLTETDATIRGADQEIARKTAALAPLRQQLAESETRLKAADETRDSARKDAETAAVAANEARARDEHLRLLGELREVEAEQALSNARSQEIATARADHDRAAEELARLPEIVADDIENLRKLTTRVLKAEGALDAVATGIEWLSGNGPAALDGAPLAVGSSRVVTAPCTLEVAGHTFRIHPGGGAKLDETRRERDEAARLLDEALRKTGAASLEEAVAGQARRSDAQARLNTLAAKLDGLDPKGNDATLTRLGRRKVELETRLAGFPPLPAELADDPASHQRAATEALLAARDLEQASRAIFQTAENQAAALREGRGKLQTQCQTAENDLTILVTARDTRVAEHGAAAVRLEAIAAAQRELESLVESHSRLAGELAALAPDQLRRDLDRHTRSLARQREEKSAAALAMAAESARMHSDGTADPHAALAEAAERLELARETHASEQRRAAAARKLAALFREEQQSLSHQLTAPFVGKIDGYLTCLFGPDARAEISLEHGEFEGLRLVRPGGPFDFDDLSGGTREQLAAAVRLAMAEILAADHDGCLPVVFDDAFTHSDPERLRTLHGMLDLAAARGLQVIVATCHPAEYAPLGARSVVLEKPAAVRTATAPSPAVPAANVDPDALLSALRALGGKAGNQSLRERLGWNEAAYQKIRDQLVADGSIVPGKGRGGSVALAEISPD